MGAFIAAKIYSPIMDNMLYIFCLLPRRNMFQETLREHLQPK